MRYVLDTNIILHIVRDSSLWKQLKTDFSLDSKHKVFISIVTYAEIKSIAKQLNWGENKTKRLDQILQSFPTLYINNEITEHYVEIDIYSQGKRQDKSSSDKISSRNMGKNDLWIAATTKYINAELITTDKDFNHLNKTFFTVHTIKQ